MSKLRRALVTGASKGIGQAAAIELAKQGFDVCVHYHSDAQGAQQTLDLITEYGGVGQLIQFDVSQREQTKTAIEGNITQFGAFYTVVSNAGIVQDTLFAGMEDEQWDSVINTNLNSFYNVVKPCILPMIKLRKGGRIITVSSLAGVEGNKGQTNYSAAKAGIIGATKALAIELASRKITANCVAPGLIETAMTSGDIPQSLLDEIPMNRMGQAYEVAAAVAFFASDAASYVTRQVLRVDGGV